MQYAKIVLDIAGKEIDGHEVMDALIGEHIVSKLNELLAHSGVTITNVNVVGTKSNVDYTGV